MNTNKYNSDHITKAISESLQRHLEKYNLTYDDLVYAELPRLFPDKLKPEAVELLNKVLQELKSEFNDMEAGELADMISEKVNSSSK